MIFITSTGSTTSKLKGLDNPVRELRVALNPHDFAEESGELILNMCTLLQDIFEEHFRILNQSILKQELGKTSTLGGAWFLIFFLV